MNQNEQNVLENEVERVREDIAPQEVTAARESIAEREIVTDEEDNRHARSLNGEKTEDSEKKEDSDNGSSSAGSAGGAAGAAGATVAAIAVVAIIITAAVSGISAAFLKLEAFGNYLQYVLSVSMIYEETEDQVLDFENIDTGLVLMVTKNGFSKSVRLATGDSGLQYEVQKTPVEGSENKYDVKITFSGTVDGLNENTRYKLAVIGDEDGKTVTYTSEYVKTTARVSEVRGVSSHCSCDKDGMFHFTLDYTDENGFYSGYAYEFRNPAGEVVRSGVIDDPKAEQHIQGVDQLPGSEYVLVVSLRSVAGTDVQAVNVSSVYLDGAVTVLIHQGVVTITANVKI